MKNLKSLNLGKSLNREEMKSIAAGLYKANDPYCYCGQTTVGTLTHCGCAAFCASEPGC
jgi:hypothetical protein